MSEFKGTPGPWSFDKKDGEVYSPKAYTSVAVVLGSSEGDANGRLIESAPDLLESLPDLSHVIAWLENGCEPEAAARELRIYQSKINRSRAKALGEEK